MKHPLEVVLRTKPVISRRAIRKSIAVHGVVVAALVTWIAVSAPLSLVAAAPAESDEPFEVSQPVMIEVSGTPSCETRWEQLNDGRVLEVSRVLPADRLETGCEAEPAALYWMPLPSRFHPQQAIGKGVAGRVWVSLLVDRHGRVAQAEPVADLNPGWEFASAAVAAVRNRRYRPLKIDGRAVASRFTDVVDFGPSVDDRDRR